MRSSWRHVGWLLITASAFAIGFYIKRPTAETPVVVAKEAPVVIAHDKSKADVPATKAPTKLVKNELHDLIIPDGPGTPPEKIDIPKHDPALAEMRKLMGHNTGSVLDAPKPLNVPIILTSDKKDAPLAMPILPDAAPKKSDALLLPEVPELPKPNINLPDASFPPPPPPAIPNIRLGAENERPKVTPTQHFKTREITLDYETTKAGTSGIKFVEVWVKNRTQSDRVWVKLERVPAGQTPLTATLPSEGVFELKLVLESETGKRTPSPNMNVSVGDAVVEVDLTPPTISVPRIDEVNEQGKVLITCALGDKNLQPQTAAIEYSVDGVQWQAIAKPPSLETGAKDGVLHAHIHHQWAVPATIGHQVHLRVSVQDAAGNRTKQTTPTKVSVDLITPTGRITRVSASKPEAERGPMPREVR